MTKQKVSKKALVIRKGNSDDAVKAAVVKLLNGTGSLLVDNRNLSTMTDVTIEKVVKAARQTGAPVIVEKGAVGPLLKALGFKGYWMFLRRGAKLFSFRFIDGRGDPRIPPDERLITV